MRKTLAGLIVVTAMLLSLVKMTKAAQKQTALKPEFHTSDRCLACHNQLITPTGRDVSIGFEWRASTMANSARDPYWQASVRRETIDHPEAKAEVEDECSVCHMPITRYEAKKLHGEDGKVFAYLPLDEHKKDSARAVDGVSCSVCHQMTQDRLGTRESFNGEFLVQTPATNNDRPEYGPFPIAPGQQNIMDTSTGGFMPTYASHIRDSALCGSCHQLYTTARGGKAVGSLPEQMPYLEWLHSEYPGKYTCQECHMPEVNELAPISSVQGMLRTGVRRHVFVGGDFFMLKMLNRYRDELNVAALPQELTAAAEGTQAFLQSQAARVEIRNLEVAGGKLQADVYVENRTGHKLPTAFPSRRAWIHFVVLDRRGKGVFESGALNPNGSIRGNDNDADPQRYEPHYREITSGDQVQIFEPILGDSNGHVTTGVLAAVGYLKDNRLLPAGFDKRTADKDIAVHGDAADDPNFTAGGDLVRYSVAVGHAEGPFRVQAELWYQPIGFRWARNLEPYEARETRRFVSYYNAMASTTATVLARAEATK